MNFSDPAWKAPSDFLLPKPFKLGEEKLLLEEMRKGGPRVKKARQKLTLGFQRIIVSFSKKMFGKGLNSWI